MTEESVDQQIKAIESWTLDVVKEVQTPNPDYKTVLEYLDNIKAQGKKLLRRHGGLKSLPKSYLADKLKKMVLETVAAALLVRKDLKSEPTLNAGIRRNLRMMESLAVKSRELIEKLMVSIPFNKFLRDKSLLIDFLTGQGDFEHIPQEIRRDQWNALIKRDLNFNGILNSGLQDYLKIIDADLSGFDFSGMTIVDCIFENVNFSKAKLIKTSMKNIAFYKNVNFSEIDGTELNLKGYFYSSTDINFNSAKLENADIFFKNNFYGKVSIKLSFVAANLRKAKLWINPNLQLGPENFKNCDVADTTFYISNNIDSSNQPSSNFLLRLAKNSRRAKFENKNF